MCGFDVAVMVAVMVTALVTCFVTVDGSLAESFVESPTTVLVGALRARVMEVASSNTDVLMFGG